MERALLGPIARQRYFIEFSAEGLLRGDSTNRASFYQSGIASGWLLPSEARRLENLPIVEGIDHANATTSA
jgi:phage portal protein BeeE